MKVLLLVFLVGVLLYFFWRRFSMQSPSASLSKIRRDNNFLLIESSSEQISKATKSTLWTVAIGFILFILILVIGMKIRILWIALPLSLYLIGQLFVYTNHVRVMKDQRIFFDPEANDVVVNFIKEESISFNLKRDILAIKEVKSVQSNKGTLFGYYKIKLSSGTLIVPYLLEQNTSSANKLFFAQLHTHRMEVESKLFPII